MSLYQSPANSGGNDGAPPTVYDPSWPLFSNLTTSQILAFQAFPQDLMSYSMKRLNAAEISGVTVNTIPLATTGAELAKLSRFQQAMDKAAFATTKFIDKTGAVHTLGVPQLQQLFVGVAQFINSLYTAYDQINTAVNATPPTITTRAQIDAIYAPLAPNSPSAINPSPT